MRPLLYAFASRESASQEIGLAAYRPVRSTAALHIVRPVANSFYLER